MPRIKNIFAQGTMDKDSNDSLVRKGVYRHAENLRVHTNDGDDGVAKNIKGTTLVSDVTDGNDDFKCVCAYFNEDKDVIYYFIATSSGQLSKVVEYDICNDNSLEILHDTTGVLNLDKDGYITGVNEIDGLLFWAEWDNNPRRINIERAKTYGTDGFTEKDIKVIVEPPLQKLRITLQNTDDTTSLKENNIKEKFITFSYRYRYLDGEYSVLAPFTNFAFRPEEFRYSFSEQANISMVNKFNQVNIDFWTGNERVEEIQLVFKESESQSVWVIDDFNKERLGYNNNEIQSFTFFNNKVYRPLANTVLPQLYDNVPRTAKAQEIIDGRLLYANYRENFNIVDSLGNDIEIDYKLNPIESEVLIDNPQPTVKSDRDYEVGVVYGDDDGRITTILNSKTNTLQIPIGKSSKKNQIEIELSSPPPEFATYFRFFIKQTKKGYETIIPTLFFFSGNFIYFLIQQADFDKVKANEYLIVKSDTAGEKDEVVKLKVLEVERKEEDFINPANGGQPDGFYIKTSVLDKEVLFDENSYSFYRQELRDQSENSDIIFNSAAEYTDVLFKGDTLDDLTVPSPLYTLGFDLRYEVEIFSIGTTDTFRFRTQETNGAFTNWDDNGGLGYDITAGLQILDVDISIQFDNITGHTLNDKWLIKKNAEFIKDENDRSYAKYVFCDPIPVGSVIQLSYYSKKVRSDDIDSFDITFISNNNYQNLEEWYYGDNIFNQISSAPDFDQTMDKFWFRKLDAVERNALGLFDNFTINPTGDCYCLFIESRRDSRNSSRDVYTNNAIEVRSLENLPVFETEPVDQPADLYYEIGKNYKIENGFHTHITDNFETEINVPATDQSQTSVQPLKVLLDWFNAFVFGNSVESYKIRDEFNRKGLDVGVRTLTNIRERYQEVVREVDIQWSDVYNDETDFNGLNNFNLSQLNFIKLDKEDASIQKIHRFNGDLLVLQEDAIGIMPYNKQIINDVQGQKVVATSTNILNRNSYRPYANGKHGISKNPESFVQEGSKNYFTDQQRGKLIRLSNDGITTVSSNFLDYYFSNQMGLNKLNKMIAGYDSRHGEYLLHLPTEGQTLGFKERVRGFPNFFTYEPDFILNANNQCYAWKNGIMYRLNSSETRNNFFGQQYESKIKFHFNDEFSVEKIWKALGIESNKPWLANLKTKLTSRSIPKECFLNKEDYWFSDIMGNTNGEIDKSSIFGLGQFEIVNGEILTTRRPDTMSIGDSIRSMNLLFTETQIVDILDDRIVLANNTLNTVSSMLMYQKNQNIDGASIRGDVLEVELINDDTEEVKLRAVNAEVSKSFYS